MNIHENNSKACPQCNGFGRTLTFHGKSLGACPMCRGVGFLSDLADRWLAYGKQLKSERLKRGLTLRAAAAFLQVDASNLSKMERGLLKPRPLWKNK